MARYDRGYDYGLRGFQETTGPQRRRVTAHFVDHMRGSGEDPRDLRPQQDIRRGVHAYGNDYDRPGMRAGWQPHVNRVTARYNLDYVREQRPGEYPINPHPYGGDMEWRVGDFNQYQRPYQTKGGSSTYRGGGRPVGWERDRARYDYLYPENRGRGYESRWF